MKMSWHTLVGYLEKAAPEAITSLRVANPNAGRLLSSDMEFGGAAENLPTAIDRSACVALVKASTESLKKDIDDLIFSMKARMKFVHKIRLGGAIVSTVMGAINAVLAMLVRASQSSNEIVALGASIVTVTAGLLALFADHFERTPTGVKFAGVEELTVLVGFRTEVERLSIRASQDALFPWPDAEVVNAANLATEVSLKVLRLKYLSPE